MRAEQNECRQENGRSGHSATCTARRVLPIPPGPVIVSRRTSGRNRSSLAAATSFSRPTNPVRCTGILLGRVSTCLIRLLREAVAYGCQFACQIPGGDVALIGLFRQTPLDRPTQRSGSVGLLHSDRFGLFTEDGHQCLRRGASPERGAFQSPFRRAPSRTRTGLSGNPAER